MAKIETGRYSDLLRRALGMKGVDSVSPELSPELSPTWQVESATNQEWSWAKGVMELGGAATQGGSAVGGHARLLNPAGSGVLVCVTQLSFAITGTTAYELSVSVNETTAGLLSPGYKAVRDTRWPSVAPLTGVTIAGVALFTHQALSGSVPVNGQIYKTHLQGETEWRWDTQVMLRPGTAVTWGGNLAADAHMSVQWRERAVSALEV